MQKVISNSDLTWPVDLFELTQLYGIKVMTYQELADRNGITLKNFIRHLPSMDGMAINIKGRDYIAYNNRKSIETQRFTIAHELGHIFMNHTEDSVDNDKLANCFARNLLCPINEIEKDELTCAYTLSEKFRINTKAAEVRLQMLSIDSYYMKKLFVEY